MDPMLHRSWKHVYRGGRLVAIVCACGCGARPIDFLTASYLRGEATNQPATG